MKEINRSEGYGTRAQGARKEEKILLVIPSVRSAEINKSEMDAVLAKCMELGIRTTKEKITLYMFNHLQRIALERSQYLFTDEEIHAIWKRYKKTVFKLTTEKIIKLVGFDPLIFSKPSRQSRK